MRRSEQHHRRHELEPSGKSVAFFLTLPVVLLVLVFLSLACEDPGRTATTDEPGVASRAASTATGPEHAGTTTSSRSDVPERPRPPLDPASEPDAAATPDEPVTFESAETAYFEGRHDEAVTLFEAYLERRPENPWGHYMLGLSAWKAGELVPAEKALRETVGMAPEHRKGWVNLARVLLDDGRPTEARESVRRALEIEPGKSDALRVLGLAEQELGNTTEAVEAYRRALVADSEDAWSMNNLALVRIRQGDFEAALPPLARAVELRDDVPVFHNNLGTALERTGRFAAAAEAYRKADELPGGHEKAAASLARVEGRGQPAELEPLDLTALADDFVGTVEEWTRERMAEAAADTTQERPEENEPEEGEPPVEEPSGEGPPRPSGERSPEERAPAGESSPESPSPEDSPEAPLPGEAAAEDSTSRSTADHDPGGAESGGIETSSSDGGSPRAADPSS